MDRESDKVSFMLLIKNMRYGKLTLLTEATGRRILGHSPFLRRVVSFSMMVTVIFFFHHSEFMIAGHTYCFQLN